MKISLINHMKFHRKLLIKHKKFIIKLCKLNQVKKLMNLEKTLLEELLLSFKKWVKKLINQLKKFKKNTKPEIHKTKLKIL